MQKHVLIDRKCLVFQTLVSCVSEMLWSLIMLNTLVMKDKHVSHVVVTSKLDQYILTAYHWFSSSDDFHWICLIL